MVNIKKMLLLNKLKKKAIKKLKMKLNNINHCISFNKLFSECFSDCIGCPSDYGLNEFDSNSDNEDTECNISNCEKCWRYAIKEFEEN